MHTLQAANDFMTMAGSMSMPAIENPFDGILPSFDFGAGFNALWKRVFAAIWGLALIAVVVFLVINIAKAGKGSSTSNPHEVSQAKGGVKQSLIALGVLIALIPVLGVLFYVIQ